MDNYYYFLDIVDFEDVQIVVMDLPSVYTLTAHPVLDRTLFLVLVLNP